jgi:hypothetical protein
MVILSECELVWLIRSRLKKGCVLLYCSSTEFDSTPTVSWNGVGCPVQTLSSGREYPFLGGSIS